MATSELHNLVAHAGRTEAIYEDPHLPGRPIRLRAARPALFSAATPLLFVHHGDLRNGGEFRDFWLPLADQHGLLVIAPEFSEADFPGSGWYSLGNCRDEHGRAKPRQQWTFGVPERIFAALGAQGVTWQKRYAQFGHSSGAQFVHRAIALGFRTTAAFAVTANAGTYAMPDLGVAFPYGLGGLGLNEAALQDLLTFPLAVFAGTADIDASSPHFPKDEPAMRQGPTRFARAHAYIAAARQASATLGISCSWSITDVPGVGHEGDRMSAAAAPRIAAALHQAAP
jgi:poly(3-hydroxybutyrate) depolymerase